MTLQKLRDFKYSIILGSASPRRKQLLADLGFTFSVQAIDADEATWPVQLVAHEIPVFLCERKSSAFPRPLKNNELLITSDTIVWHHNKVFNKPSGYEEGKKMLIELSGGSHQVFTAVCLKSAEKQITFYAATTVFFKKLSQEEIEHYLTTYKPYDKAGSYGVQEWIGYIGIEKIDGSFYNVMGLPVKELYEELLRF